ncbi:HNH endonuclease signature motif containing protein [Arthrobacter antibioticus]|uniref:HNH endonuclease signature motif containing protein n=1 Tax=Arthrobacter sp. H35-MC1 TaxID=3046203 RepID=UPI0024B9EC1D|nr:HNH endonuclease signature motif containing protein [Arthrobacter sp. H35-MC1]MDJ0316582.1 DUF222 domain-containing protein [Arthrobacter sp. H35-MC1]
MGSSVNFPAGRDVSSTTMGVADFIAGLVLPVIGPLANDIAAMVSLPDFPGPNGDLGITASEAGVADGVVVGGALPTSRLGCVRALMDECTAAIEALRVHQNQCAALAAVLMERLSCAGGLEGSILAFDAFQREGSMSGLRAEVAGVLQIPEGVAGELMTHSRTLVRELPGTLSCMSTGALGWDYAVIIAQETALVRQSGVPAAAVDSLEQVLLGKAEDCTVSSFREKARRQRERLYPETITARTRRALSDRYLRVNRGHDGMSWLSLYGPAPTLEGIWSQCTLTAQSAQGPHETRTLTQLRADIAASLLLNQSMAQNHIHSPAPPMQPDASEDSAEMPEHQGIPGCVQISGCGESWFSTLDSEPHRDQEDRDQEDRDQEDLTADEGSWRVDPQLIPVFDDPHYTDPGFKDPDIRNDPQWDPTARPPTLTPPPGSVSGPLPGSSSGSSSQTTDGRHRGHRRGNHSGAAGVGGGVVMEEVWPPLPQVTPVLLIPVLSLLGATQDPAWLEGAGPISMEVARRLTQGSKSLLRVLVDPVSNEPLDAAPQRYRISKAMRTMLAIRDEYCQFPGCLARASNCQIDHIKKFAHGGRSIFNNLETLCHHHHLLKHFKDDQTRNGACRTDQSPQRQAMKLRGWTPTNTQGRIAWTSPSGRYYPPATHEDHAPSYPKWLKKHLETEDRNALEDHEEARIQNMDQANPYSTPLPTPPPGTYPCAEDEETLNEQTLNHYLAHHNTT